MEGDPALAATTDVVVTSDHGFSTISRRDVDAEGHASQSPSTKRRAPDVRPGDLPPGFVAIDVAAHLGLKLCDPDRVGIGVGGQSGYAPIGAEEHPSLGNGLIAAELRWRRAARRQGGRGGQRRDGSHLRARR